MYFNVCIHIYTYTCLFHIHIHILTDSLSYTYFCTYFQWVAQPPSWQVGTFFPNFKVRHCNFTERGESRTGEDRALVKLAYLRGHEI